MKLYEFEWGPYPRRVGIYLAEKGIGDVERIAFDMPGSWPPPEIARMGPPGTVPVLEADDGTLIRASVAILEYLEERFPAPSMLGSTAEARARTRVLVSVADEAMIQFGIWCHKASPLFSAHEPQHPAAAAFAREGYFGRLRVLESLVVAQDPFLAGPDVTIADCVAFATLQFAELFYGVPLPEDCPRLAQWYRRFATRPSAAPPAYPASLLAMSLGLPAAPAFLVA